MKRLLLFVLVATTGVLPMFHAHAFKAGRQQPLPNFDKRHENRPQPNLPPGRAEAAEKLRERDVKVQIDPLLETPKYIGAQHRFLREADAAPGHPHGPVKAFLNENSALFGHGAEVLDAARIKREFVTPHNGLRTVIWEQQIDDIPVFEAQFVAHLSRKAELVNVSSRLLPDASGAADAELGDRKAVRNKPRFSPLDAIAEAAKWVGDEVRAEDVTPVDQESTGPEKRQRFKAPKLNGDIHAQLVWVPSSRNKVRLAWEVLFASKSRGEMFMFLVDCQHGDVILRRCLTENISDATYNVFISDSPAPFSPGHPTPLTNQPALVNRVLVVTNALSTNASPNGWINDGDNETLGNNVDAHTDIDNDNQPDLPRPQGNNRVFDFPLDLTQEATNYASAAVVNLFYWNNWIHDKLYDLGFTEAAGNFQVDNFGRGGIGNDAVSADAQDGGGFNNANMSTPRDGIPARMQMYLFDGPSPDRDGDYDAEIIIHEYMHGLSNRRVGGGVGLSALQSRGMGEGWGDFYAVTFLGEASDNVDDVYAMGGYSTYQFLAPLIRNFDLNYYFGIRRYPYSTDMTKNPLTFKDIDPTQADGHVGVPLSPWLQPFDPRDASEVHNQGEVWCMVLLEARANLIKKYGYAVGNQQILELVTDGMNLSPPDPNFLQSRDAILQADLVNNGLANFNELWSAFAKRGMGGSASAPDSGTTRGVEEAFDFPGVAFSRAVIRDSSTGNGNGAVDFNECIELFVTLANNGRTNATAVNATLTTTTPGVLISQPSSSYPNILPAGSGANFEAFKFYTTPQFECGTRIQFILTVQTAQETRVIRFQVESGLVGPATRYNNSNPINIPDGQFGGVDSPITVSGFNSPIGRLTVSLHALHPRDLDLQFILISPDGTEVVLSANNGFFSANYGAACTPDTQRTTFDDKASVSIGAGAPPFIGSFRPDEPLSAFTLKRGPGVNGTWRLRVRDVFNTQVGTLQCWSMNISPILCADGGGDCSTDVAVTGAFSPAIPIVGSNLVYSFTVTNRGPNTARNVSLSDNLPAGLTYVSANSSQGNCVHNNGLVTCPLGTMQAGGTNLVRITVRPTTASTFTNIGVVTSGTTDSQPTNNTAVVIATVRPPVPIIVPARTVLLAESAQPANGGIDSGETVTIDFGLENVGSLPTANLVATLQSGTGVAGPSEPQTYGAVVPGGPVVARTFTFTAAASSGSTVSPTFQLQDGTNNLGVVTFTFGIGGSRTIENQGVIIIQDNRAASIYPSPLFVSGLSGLVSRVSITLSNVTHAFPDDIDVLLTGPNGRSAIVMADAGGGFALNNAILSFGGNASAPAPDEDPLLSGFYRPANYEPDDVFPAPAPVGPHPATLSVFEGADPNGAWSLYVMDDQEGDQGRINGGWALTIETFDPVNPSADLRLLLTDAPDPVLIGSNYTYSLVITNGGGDTATGVSVSGNVPPGTSVVDLGSSQGSCVLQGNSINCNIGILTNRAQAEVTVRLTTSQAGTKTFTANVSAAEFDPNTGNNTNSVTTVVSPTADLYVLALATPDPVSLGRSVTYSLTVSNLGPSTAQGVTLRDVLPSDVVLGAITPSQGSCTTSNGVVTCTLNSILAARRATVSITVTPNSIGFITNSVSVASTNQADLGSSNNAVTLITRVNDPALIIVPAGARLVSESLSPPNGGPDSGETISVQLGLQNVGSENTAALQAVLPSGNGLVSLTSTQNYGVLVAGGPPVFRTFTFTVNGAPGSVVQANLQLRDGSSALGTVSFPFIVSAQPSLFNTNGIALADNGPAIPYPSSIDVSGQTGIVTKVTIGINGLSHDYPDDIDILLISPNGRKVLLMSDVGNGRAVTNLSILFDDAATVSLPDATVLSSGTYRPTNVGTNDQFPPPALNPPFETQLSAFNGSEPNGTWSLYVVDDTIGDIGSIRSWSLTLTTIGVVNPLADLSTFIGNVSQPNFVGGEVTYTLTASNRGPVTATNLRVTNVFPNGLSFLSATPSQGTISQAGNQLILNAGNLANGLTATAVVRLRAQTNGIFTITASASSDEFDLVSANNSATASATVFRLPQLRFAAPVGQRRFAVTSEAAGTYVLEATSNLTPPVTWSEIDSEAVAANAQFELSDPGQTNVTRFYRVKRIR